MDALPRTHIAAAVVLLALAGLLGMRMAGAKSSAPPVAPQPVQVQRSGDAGGEALVVHVAGAVRRPGVYRMRQGARVDDAVRRAGGATRRADLTAVNLAAEIEDGRQVLVPLRARTVRAGGTASAPAASAAVGDAAAPAGPLNLNQATLEQLDQLDGVGPATAQKIIDWREQHGGFTRVEELDQVSGIGEKRLATLRAGVTV
jgi:competence protein ComEA